jgi:hypothetical protein
LGIDLEGAVEGTISLIAASRLNGRPDAVCNEAGGSTRVKGAEVRRFLKIPTVLRGGDLPAGAVKGVRADTLLVFFGVAKLRADAASGLRVKLNGLAGISKEKVLAFFDGEEIMPGSTFSPSESLGVLGSYERLLVIGVLGIVKVKAVFSALPPSMLDLLSRADMPD